MNGLHETRAEADDTVYLRAETERVENLQREVERLRVDLGQAEEALVRIESGLRTPHTRADAVSSLAQARIQLDRAAADTPWRVNAIREARNRLEESEKQTREGHFSAAIIFASRVQRIAEDLLREAHAAAERGDSRRIRASRVNLRAGPSREHPVLEILTLQTPVIPEGARGSWVLVRSPSGTVGWVHDSLLASR